MRYCFYCLFFASMLSIFSCNNNHQNTIAKTSTQKQTLDTADAHLAILLSLFCTKQVMAGELATKQSSTKKVKDFGKQVSDLYTQLGNRLNLISENYFIQLPYPLTIISKENFQGLKK